MPRLSLEANPPQHHGPAHGQTPGFFPLPLSRAEGVDDDHRLAPSGAWAASGTMVPAAGPESLPRSGAGSLTLYGCEVGVDAVGAYGYELVDKVKASPADAGVVVLGVKPEHEVDDIHGLGGGRGTDVADGGAVQANEPLADFEGHGWERLAALIKQMQDNAGVVVKRGAVGEGFQ